MIHYHGLPITPAPAALRVVKGSHVFVCVKHDEQLTMAIEYAQSFAGDNGAYPAWRSGKPIKDWKFFYEWVQNIHRYPAFDFAVIPDVIDGDEEQNDQLLNEWPWPKSQIGAPVWHMHESIERLVRLAKNWPRVCLGSSGQFASVGTKAWRTRMDEAMNAICDSNGLPICKLHGLRMLNPKVFCDYPLSSADSTNIARNIGIDSAWKGTYTPPNKEVRAMVMQERIESVQSAARWKRNLLDF